MPSGVSFEVVGNCRKEQCISWRVAYKPTGKFDSLFLMRDKHMYRNWIVTVYISCDVQIYKQTVLTTFRNVLENAFRSFRKCEGAFKLHKLLRKVLTEVATYNTMTSWSNSKTDLSTVFGNLLDLRSGNLWTKKQTFRRTPHTTNDDDHTEWIKALKGPGTKHSRHWRRAATVVYQTADETTKVSSIASLDPVAQYSLKISCQFPWPVSQKCFLLDFQRGVQ